MPISAQVHGLRDPRPPLWSGLIAVIVGIPLLFAPKPVFVILGTMLIMVAVALLVVAGSRVQKIKAFDQVRRNQTP